jgi:hypothetical protein
MSDDNDLQDGGTAGGDDGLGGALGAGDSEFVVPSEKPKGGGQFAIFGLVAVAAAVTYFMYWKTGPQDAAAATTDAAANAAITQFLTDGQASLRTMEQMRASTEKVVARFMKYPANTQVPLGQLRANPFRFMEAAPKADATAAAAKRKREEERAAATRAVGGLQLQSVIHSDKVRACMINNAMYQEGQQVDAFTVERIEPGGVIVKTNGFRFSLKMQQK